MENVKLTPYLILYRDEFKVDVWRQYCAILGADTSADKITITVKDFEVEYDNETVVK